MARTDKHFKIVLRMQKKHHIKFTNPLASRPVRWSKIQTIKVFEWTESIVRSVVKTFPQSSALLLPYGNSGKVKRGKDRADKVLRRGGSIETGDLGRLAPAEAIGRVLVKVDGKPGMVGTIAGPQPGSLTRAQTRPSHKCLYERWEMRWQTRGARQNKNIEICCKKKQTQMARTVPGSQLGSMARAQTRPFQKRLSTRGKERVGKLAVPAKTKMSRSVARKIDPDGRDYSRFTTGKPHKGANTPIPQMPLCKRRGTHWQACGACQTKNV